MHSVLLFSHIPFHFANLLLAQAATFKMLRCAFAAANVYMEAKISRKIQMLLCRRLRWERFVCSFSLGCCSLSFCFHVDTEQMRLLSLWLSSWLRVCCHRFGVRDATGLSCVSFDFVLWASVRLFEHSPSTAEHMQDIEPIRECVYTLSSRCRRYLTRNSVWIFSHSM